MIFLYKPLSSSFRFKNAQSNIFCGVVNDSNSFKSVEFKKFEDFKFVGERGIETSYVATVSLVGREFFLQFFSCSVF